MVKVAVMGYGTIGSGVVEILEKNRERIKKTSGEELEVKYVLDLREFEGDPIQSKIVHDYRIIADDPEVRIVVETMGGVEPAYTFVKAMLEAGKQVTTSNKALVAEKGAELIALATEKNVNFLFEASVGGGIPIIRPLMSSITGDEIVEISGIVNGTTNYMLTKMYNEGVDYDTVLKEAQEKGYAERNPEADVEGHDACRKIAILSSLAYGKRVDFTDIYTEGITKITPADIMYAKAMKKTIKLLAYSHRDGDQVVAMVAPYLVGQDDPLSGVNGVFNAIFVHGNMLGDAMFYGRGAGKEATASAVVADVIEEAQVLGRSVMSEWSAEKQEITPVADMKTRFFVRVSGKIAQASQVERIFGKIQTVQAGLEDEFGFVTDVMTEQEYAEKAAQTEGIRGMLRIREK